jgi:hypothetical protein
MRRSAGRGEAAKSSTLAATEPLSPARQVTLADLDGDIRRALPMAAARDPRQRIWRTRQRGVRVTSDGSKVDERR